MSEQNRIKIILIFTLAASAVFPSPNASAETFGPWSPDVNVGDKNLPSDRAGAVRDPARPPVPAFSGGRSLSPVYNGFQGGAFFLLRFFQVVISPQDGPSCRFHPVCSAYARQAVERFGALAGSVMAGDRLLRCNPFNDPGRDPVPRAVPNP